MSETLEYRVYGPPGTGKTTWISNKVREMVDQVGGDQVSVCSMTRAAVKEIVGRDIPVPEDNISTLHARCKRSLGAGAPAESRIAEFIKAYPKFANELTLPAYLLKGARQENGTDEIMLSGGGISLYEKAQILRQQMVPLKNWAPQVANWYAIWSRWCREEGVLDFTGWLEEAMRCNVLPVQQVVFVDEAQDHTPLQIAVIRSWPTRHRILVGDDDQGIYEWSGAVPMTFLNPKLPSSREKVLSQSYRVPRRIHALASKWIAQVRTRRAKDYAPKDQEGEVVMSQLQLTTAKYDSRALLDTLKLDGRSIMILTSCGFQLTDILAVLKAENVPFHNPYRRSNKAWNPLDGPMTIMRSFLVGEREWTGIEISTWVPILKARQMFRNGGQKRLLEACQELEGESVSESLLRKCFLPGRIDEVLAQDVRLFINDRKLGVSGDWKYAFKVLEAYGVNVKPDIIVGTIHSVKGGEANDVLLFPDLSAAGNREYLGRARDGIIRLFYVGMTRASERLILGEQSGMNSVNWRI